MSNTGLILNRDDAEATHEFLVYVIPFDIERRPAQREDTSRRIDELAVRKSFDKGFIARLLHQVGDAIHGAIQVPHLPFGCARSPVQHLGGAIGIDMQLKGRCALGAQAPFVVRAARIAFDVHNLAVDRVDQRRAANGAERTHARRHFGAGDPQLLCLRHDGREADA